MTREEFLKRLRESGQLSEADLQVVLAALPADKQPQDAQQLARLLVRQKQLTAFQAQQIYAGKGKSLVLGNGGKGVALHHSGSPRSGIRARQGRCPSGEM